MYLKTWSLLKRRLLNCNKDCTLHYTSAWNSSRTSDIFQPISVFVQAFSSLVGHNILTVGKKLPIINLYSDVPANFYKCLIKYAFGQTLCPSISVSLFQALLQYTQYGCLNSQSLLILMMAGSRPVEATSPWTKPAPMFAMTTTVKLLGWYKYLF